MVANSLFIESPHSFNKRILILSFPGALLESSFLIILITCSNREIDVKTESVWVVNHVANWLLLTRGVHGRAKYELESSQFVLVSDINWLLCYIWRYTSYFLSFKNPFRKDQYFLGLRLITYVTYFCVNKILNISKVKLKILIALTVGCVFVNLIFVFYFHFSIKTRRLPVIKDHQLIWNKIAHGTQKCFK